MAYTSPGVYVKETDASAIVPSQSNSTAFFAGKFYSGPVGEPTMVTSKDELVTVFGKPDDYNFNDFYQAYKFLDYANKLIITRAYNEFDDNYIPSVGSEYVIDMRSSAWNVLDDRGHSGNVYFWMQLGDNYKQWRNSQTKVGDIIELPGVASLAGVYLRVDGMEFVPSGSIGNYDPHAYVYVTCSEATTLNVQQNNFNEDYDPEKEFFEAQKIKSTKPKSTKSTKSTKNTKDASVLATPPTQWDKDSTIRIYTFGHLNGYTEATYRGDVETIGNNIVQPVEARAILESDNIDIGEKVVIQEFDENLLVPIKAFNNNRLNVNYKLIKSKKHFDDLTNWRNGTNTLKSFELDTSIINFYSRYPNSDRYEDIEIAIANWYDFQYLRDENGIYNEAVAFNYDGRLYYLTDLFQYAPSQKEIAIAVRCGDDIETFIVSLNKEGVDGNNRSNFIEQVINENSKYIYCTSRITSGLDPDSPYWPASYLYCDKAGLDEFLQPKVIPGTNKTGIKTSTLKVQGSRAKEISYSGMKIAYDSVLDKELYEIDVIIGNEFYPTLGSTGTDTNQNLAIELADKRKDCIAFVGATYWDTVGKTAQEATSNIIDYILQPDGNTVKLNRSMFGAFFGNYARIYDVYGKKYRWINIAGDMAGIRCSVNTNNEAWWASAGMRRGQIRGVDKLAFSPNQAQRDELYKNGINPVVTFPGTGHLVWGNKTLLAYASAFDRINVRSLFNVIERAMAKAARSEVFEFNDEYTRNSLLSMFNPYLSSIKAARGITDYLVICDESNNTPDVISRNELVCDIYIKPNYTAEFITLHFVNVGTRSFASVIGA